MPTRQFNVYSEKVVAYPNETFNWFASVNALENGSVSVQSSSWPLVPASCQLTSSNPTFSVSVPNTAVAPNQYQFSCTPVDPDVTTQTLIIARQYVDSLCNDVVVSANDHFIWHNTTPLAVTIAPDPGNTDDWPLAQAQYDLAPGDWVAVPIPADAQGGDYNLSITYSDGSQPCMQMGTQPKLSVGSSLAAGQKQAGK